MQVCEFLLLLGGVALEHVGLDVAGADRVHPDVVLGVIGTQRLGQPDDAVLRGGIRVQAALARDGAVDGGHVHDRPRGVVALGEELLELVVAPVGHAVEIEVDQRIPVVKILLGQRNAVVPAASVVECEVERAERIHRELHRVLVAFPARGVELERGGLCAARGELVGRCFRGVEVEVRDDNAGALTGELGCGCFANAGGAAGDEGDASFETVAHGFKATSKSNALKVRNMSRYEPPVVPPKAWETAHMSCTIFYSSVYGSTREYAEELAARVGTTAQPIPATEPALASGPVVILAPAHGPMNDAAKFALSLTDEVCKTHPVAVVTTGMTLDEEVAAKDPTADLLRGRAGQTTRFYLPGRMNYSELSSQHKAVMKGLITALRMKPGKTANERNMIDMYGRDVDRVDLSRLDPIVEWIEAQ